MTRGLVCHISRIARRSLEYTAVMSRVRRLLRRLEPRFLQRSIGARVLAGFLLTAVLAGAVASVSLAYNTDVARQLAQVTQQDRDISSALRDLEVAVEQQTGAIQNFLLSGDEHDLDTLRAGRARFGAALARLEQRLPPDRREEGLALIRARAQAMDEIAEEEIALARQGWAGHARYLWRTEGLETKARLLSAVQGETQAHNASVDAEIAASRAHLRLSFGLSLGLVALAAALALMIGMGISRAVTRPVRSLLRVATAVRGGDYSVRAPVTGQDELATLSATMNAMVESLHESRAQLEQALAETERSEERYRLLTVNASDIIFMLDRQNRITFVNQAIKQTLGYEPEEVIGRPASMLWSKKTDQFVAEHGGWVATEPRSLTTDIELVTKDGRIVPFEVKASVMRVGGHTIGVQGIARDMTERYRMEQELRRLHLQDRRRVDQLITVNEVGRKIAALQPVDTLLPHLVRMLGVTFGYHHVRILLVQEDGSLTTAAAWHKAGRDSDDSTPSVSPLVLRALRGDAGFVAGSGRPEDTAEVRHTEVAVPVRTKTGVLGVLDIRDDEEGGLDERDIFTLQTLADQVAVAIENARLYETGQQLAVSEERNRLARELHDSVTQELFSMTMITDALPMLMDKRPEAAKERMQRLHELARGALAEMRALLFALRPAALAEEGLVAAITKHAAAVEAREGLAVHVEIEGDGRPPQPVEEALYRVFQEALNNVVKHAKAKTVWVRLAIDAEQTVLSVRDDGIGMDAGVQLGMKTMGLASMRERVAAIHGEFRLESAPGAGTTVHVTAPAGATQRAVDAGVASVP